MQEVRVQDSPHFVYLLRDGTGRVLYVGVTYALKRRIQDHARKPWFSQVASTEHETYPDHFTALQREKQLIRETSPVYNVHRYLPPRKEDRTFFHVGVPRPQVQSMRLVAESLGYHFPACTRTNEEGNVTALLLALFAASEDDPQKMMAALRSILQPGLEKGRKRKPPATDAAGGRG